jgi:hypothetical protein
VNFTNLVCTRILVYRITFSIYVHLRLLFTLLFIQNIYIFLPNWLSSGIQVELTRWVSQDNCYCIRGSLDWYCAAAMHVLSFTVLLAEFFFLVPLFGSFICVNLLYQMNTASWPAILLLYFLLSTLLSLIIYTSETTDGLKYCRYTQKWLICM